MANIFTSYLQDDEDDPYAPYAAPPVQPAPVDPIPQLQLQDIPALGAQPVANPAQPETREPVADPFKVAAKWMAMRQQGAEKQMAGGGIQLPAPPMPPAARRNDWSNTLGMVADAIGNKGANFQQLLAQQRGEAAQADQIDYTRGRQYYDDQMQGIKAQNDAARAAAMDARTGRSLELQDKRMQQEIARGEREDRRLDQADQRLGLQGGAEDRRKQAFQFTYEQNTPDSDTSNRVRELLIARGVNAGEIAGLSARDMRELFPALKADIEHAMAPRAAADDARRASMVAGAGEQARSNVELRMQPQIATATQSATLPGKLDEARAKEAINTAGELSRDEAKRGAELERAGAAFPGVKVADQGAYARFMSNPTEAAKLRSKSDAYQVMDRAIDTAIKLQTDATFAQRLGKGDAQSAYDEAKGQYIGKLGEMLNTGVINQGEYDRMSKRFPDFSPGMADLQGKFSGKNVRRDQLEGARRSFRQGAEAGFTSAGALPDWGAADRAKQGRTPKGKADGQTGQTLRLPDGRRISVAGKDPEKIKRAIAKGAVLE